MSKLRVHDMAGEFGISADEVMGLLRTMDVPVRTHFSPLTDEQVARVRARWEREKRARVEKPAPAPRRRRGAAAPAERAGRCRPIGGWRDRRAPSPAIQLSQHPPKPPRPRPLTRQRSRLRRRAQRRPWRKPVLLRRHRRAPAFVDALPSPESSRRRSRVPPRRPQPA